VLGGVAVRPDWERTGLRLLVVDDDVLDRKSIRRALVAGGVDAEISEAGDAERGLELLASEPVDAVLLDFNMPRRDGLWLVREARSEEHTSELQSREKLV